MRKAEIFWGLLVTFFLTLPLQGQNNAVINQQITAPTYVNILWDSAWDNDNNPMKMAAIDAVMESVMRSSYFNGLSEYGIGSISYMGSFLPSPQCPLKAPDSVGFWDPFHASIAGFIQCEHDNGPSLFRQNNVIYNIILPASSMESDMWTRTFCTGPGSPNAWHFHGLKDTPPWPFGGGPFSGQPIYTIILTNPACFSNSDNMFKSLTHEMVEAATNPFPIYLSIIPPQADVTFDGEIADKCENPPAPQVSQVQIFADSSGMSPMTTPISLATYFSNTRQTCVGFSDTTQPTINKVTVSNWGTQTAFGIYGDGFDVVMFPVPLPAAGLPYVEVKDTARNWEAGNVINGDLTPLVISSWFNTQVVNIGFGGIGGTVNNVPNEPLTVWVCNPNSLKCASYAATSAPGPYNPRLNVMNLVTGEFALKDTITISQGSQQVLKNNVDNRCAPCVFSSVQTLTPGSYSFTQTVTGKIAMAKVTNGCQHVTLSAGQETSCVVADTGPPLPDACQRNCSAQLAACSKIKPPDPKLCAQQQATCLKKCI